MHSRRVFLKNASAVSAGFLGLERLCANTDTPAAAVAEPYGPLLDDPILKLPKGFRYQVLSELGDVMTDGYKTPGKPDGMAAFEADDGRVVLVRNHELALSMADHGPFEDNSRLPDGFKRANCYDSGGSGEGADDGRDHEHGLQRGDREAGFSLHQFVWHRSQLRRRANAVGNVGDM